jgi:regulator of replication initiation timing
LRAGEFVGGGIDMRLTEVKERLSKLIPERKWKTEISYMEEPGYEQFIKKINIIYMRGKTVYVVASMNWSNPPIDTAEFIAHAPEDMDFLLDTIESLQQENKVLDKQNKNLRDGLNRIRERAEVFYRKGISGRPRKSGVNACSWIYEECFGIMGELNKRDVIDKLGEGK